MRRLLLVGKNFLASSMPFRNARLSMSMSPPFWPLKKAEASTAWSPSLAGNVVVFLFISSPPVSFKNAELWTPVLPS
uniref:Uncharacterized protein n=1 Tax=Arundo donax TaxID=35708 RepID=A0A0A9BRL5_ARUDO